MKRQRRASYAYARAISPRGLTPQFLEELDVKTTTFGAERFRDEVILVGRILLLLLFLVFGWSKLMSYGGTVGYMTQAGAPIPSLAALVAIVVEVFVAVAVILGVWTRPLALLLAV